MKPPNGVSKLKSCFYVQMINNVRYFKYLHF